MSCSNDSGRTGKFRLKDVTNDPIRPIVDLEKQSEDGGQNKVKWSSSTKKNQMTHSMFRRGRNRLIFHDNPQYHFSIKNVAINSVHTPSFFSRFAPTINNMKWRYILLLFFAGIIGSWLFFALIYWMISSLDLSHFNKSGLDGMNCLINVTDFPSALLYSMELQSTIGFGYRYVNSKCWYGVVVSILHAAFGTIFQAVLLMTILNKLTRPVLQNKSVVFSDKVVLYKDEDSSIESPDSKQQRSSDIWILKFRIGNVNNLSNLLNYNITTQLVIPTVRKSELESQVILRTHDLKISTLSRNKDGSVLNWPTEIVHYVDEKSPFKRYTTYIERVILHIINRFSLIFLKIYVKIKQLFLKSYTIESIRFILGI
ncbi:MAG: inward rectifier potassium channel 2 [Marteilia pararefringens]